MAGFADLVPQAQPALVGGGAEARATAGRTWKWEFADVLDSAGDPVDLSGATGTCKVWRDVGGAEVTTLTFTGAADGTFTLTKDETATASLATGSWTWGLYVVSGGDSVQFWGPHNSRFVIIPEA